MKYLYLLTFSAIGIFTSCATSSGNEITTDHQTNNDHALELPSAGNWLGKLALPDGYYIPFNFVVEDSMVTIQNSSEAISTVLRVEDDSLYFKMPAFDSEFKFQLTDDNNASGYWINKSKKDYRIPFTAKTTNTPKQRFDHAVNNSSANFDGKWETHFELKSKPYPAIGVFEQYQEDVTGTFLTETGDYRYLQGNVINDTLFLSCFDGAHAFLFTAVQEADSIRGMFYSGNHYVDSLWVGRRNDAYELTDPDSLTNLNADAGPFSFSFPGIDAETVTYPADKYNGKAVIVQIFGSWCPNCKDEAEFYAELYDQYHDQGLEIIGIGFERPEDLEGKKTRIRDFATALDIPYEFAVGGSSQKSEAQAAIPQLEHVMSFPTSVFIDRQGKIRKIHTGFYGPGTGKYYHNYRERITNFIKELLLENEA